MSKIKKIKEEETPIEVRMVLPKKSKATRNYEQTILSYHRLGKEMRISPKANAAVNDAGFKAEFYVPTVTVNVGIGKDYSADLVMTLDAWKAWQNGQEISIMTTEQFKKYIHEDILETK